jgi:hypothetical protein
MHACLHILTLIPAVVICAAIQPIITPPETIVECEQTVFTWSGGGPPYSFYYGPGHEGFGDDDGVETEELVQDGIIAPAVTFYAPYSGWCFIYPSCFARVADISPPDGLPWRFRVADGTQSASACEAVLLLLVVSPVLMHETGMYIQVSGSCFPTVSDRSWRMLSATNVGT